MRVPQHVEEITARWVDEALRAGGAADLPEVSAVRTQVIGNEKGFLSQTMRIEIDYTGSGRGAPTSLVVKIEPELASLLEAERGSKAFDREIRFYREVACRVPLRVPRIYYADASDASA